MKMRILSFALLASCLMACGGNKQKGGSVGANHPYDGTFTTKYNMKFRLNADSTTLLLFNDSIPYEGVWKIRHQGDMEYVNIEFSGDYNYYYLKDGKLYRKEQQMQKGVNGIDVTYID